MDDNRSAACSSPAAYRCPGQKYTIGRAVHLARLAAYYPACSQCEHRHDTGGLSPLQLRDWPQLERRAADGPRAGSEGFVAETAGRMDAAMVGRVAAALATSLWRREESQPHAPTVLIGSDGTWTTAELVPAACRGLQLAGCRVLETGAVTSACLASAAAHLRAEAALWVGNSSGAPHATHIKLWHAAGRPSSSPGCLDDVFDNYESSSVRSKRGGGALQRFGAEEVYLPKLAGLFHGLRPLVFVLDTTCHAVVRYWNRLNDQSACRMVPLRTPLVAARGHSADQSPQARRGNAVACEVLAAGAHFGMWIDGDGETCRLFDERGECVDACAFFRLLAGYACRQQPAAGIVLEAAAAADSQRALEQIGARVFRGGATRQSMGQRMESTGALVGGGPSGRYWFSGPPAAPDALLSLCLLISLLSQSDRPLSEVLDVAPTAG